MASDIWFGNTITFIYNTSKALESAFRLIRDGINKILSLNLDAAKTQLNQFHQKFELIYFLRQTQKIR